MFSNCVSKFQKILDRLIGVQLHKFGDESSRKDNSLYAHIKLRKSQQDFKNNCMKTSVQCVEQ